MNQERKIRPIVIAIFHRNDEILAAEMVIDGKLCYRPVGGGIEYGEYGIDTLRREMREELQEEIYAIVYRGTLENIFTMSSELGHEIVLVYDAKFVNSALYQQDTIVGYEEATDETFVNHWLPISYFAADDAPALYPHGLLEMLTGTSSN